MILQKPKFLRSHPSVTIKPPLPRHGLKAVGVSSMGASGEKNANCFTVSKWQIPLPLVAPSPFLGGATQSVAGGMGLKSGTLFSRPPNGVQGQRPWHAFGDFRRETKVTRGGGAERPLVGSAEGQRPSHIGPRRGPRPCKAPEGDRSPPSTYTPKRTKSCIPTCNSGKEKNKKRKPPCFSAGPVLYSI